MKAKIFKKKAPVSDLYRYLDLNNSKSSTSTSTFTMDSEPRRPLIPFPPASNIPMLEFDEVEEFEKTKKFLSKKAKELGGTMNWYDSPDGLCIYTFDFEDEVSYRKFEDILMDTATFGIPPFEEEEKKIDDDINDMLSEIENR